MKKRTLLIITLVCCLLTGYAFSSDVTDLSGKKYFPAVKEAIDNSEKSIFMVVYIVDFDERVMSDNYNYQSHCLKKKCYH
ncbi:MAG: hypothetical protein KAS46_05230 [Candidatus Aureabacteria bacterium]|nr:hypothetical protein [Candidatus Auribacterota bacterium]